MMNVNLQGFVWFDLGPKPPKMMINVSETGGFTFNRPAWEALPPHIKIGILPDGKTVCVVEGPASGYTLPKSGTVTRPELIEHIVSAGIVLPARYSMRQENNYWIAELQAPTPKKRLPVRHPRRISKSAEESILKEIINWRRPSAISGAATWTGLQRNRPSPPKGAADKIKNILGTMPAAALYPQDKNTEQSKAIPCSCDKPDSL